MKQRTLLLSLSLLISCTPYTETYPIQGKWYQDRPTSTKRDILYFTDDGWLLIGVDHGIYTEEVSKHIIQYWNGMISMEGQNYDYKIYGKYLQIFDDEYKRVVE